MHTPSAVGVGWGVRDVQLQVNCVAAALGAYYANITLIGCCYLHIARDRYYAVFDWLMVSLCKLSFSNLSGDLRQS